MVVSRVDFESSASLDKVEEHLSSRSLKSAQAVLQTVRTDDPRVLARMGAAEVLIREQRIDQVVHSTLTGSPDAKFQKTELLEDYAVTQATLRKIAAAERGEEIEAEEADPDDADVQMEMAEMAECFYKGNHKKGFGLFNTLPYDIKQELNERFEEMGVSLFAPGEFTTIPRAIWGYLNELSGSGNGVPTVTELHALFAAADAAANGP